MLDALAQGDLISMSTPVAGATTLAPCDGHALFRV